LNIVPIRLKNKQLRLSIARLDEQNLLASGNKFYKLQPNFEYAKQKGKQRLISFGGAFSNHIHALALFGQQAGFKTLGIIRGEPENAEAYSENPTLLEAQKAGMELQFINRKEYRLRHDKRYLENLQQRYPDALIIPEGGSNQFAVSGCEAISQQINQIQQTDIITVACGTGATLAGIASGLNDQQIAVGYSVLRDQSMQQRIAMLIKNNSATKPNWSLKNADFGGYAKIDKNLLVFIFDWLEKTGILLDPIYTSKMCMRIMQQIEAEEFAPDTSICMVHSGGLQGWRGMEKKVTHLVGKDKWDKIVENL